MRALACAAVALVSLTACFGPDADLTESGKGRPLVDVEFPDAVDPGSTTTATVTVENRGPGDMGTVVVAFAAVGVAAASGPLPQQLVPPASARDNPAIGAIAPEPRSVSGDGVVYVFGRLEEDATMEIEFEIVAPSTPGPAASSVSVYDGAEADRIRGVRLETLVKG